MEDFICSVFCMILMESYNYFFVKNDLHVNVLKLCICFLCFQRFFYLSCKPLNIFLSSCLWCSCTCLSELYCDASPLHICIAMFAGFDANSVSKFLCTAEEHKCINCGREISINKMWKGNSRGEKG